MILVSVQIVFVDVHNTAATSTRAINIYGIHFYIVLTALHLMVRGYCHVIVITEMHNSGNEAEKVMVKEGDGDGDGDRDRDRKRRSNTPVRKTNQSQCCM